MRSSTAARYQSMLLVAACLLWLGGCESDITSPQDDLPLLTEQETAVQAGYFTKIFGQLYGEIQDAVTEKDQYEHRLGGPDLTGSFTLASFDGPTGLSIGLDDPRASFVRIWTNEGQRVEIGTDSGKPLSSITFDLAISPYLNTPGQETGTINGAGVFFAGGYRATFQIAAVDLGPSDYPVAGEILYRTGEENEICISFDGTGSATVETGDFSYRVDLATGDLVLVLP
ncbi:MAG: hypothetical protein ABIF77_14260 [bacterium]